MSWDDIDKPDKKGIDARFVSCEEPYELDYIRKVIQRDFPELSKARIDAAIAHCCETIRAPRPRKAFVECLKKQLA